MPLVADSEPLRRGRRERGEKKKNRPRRGRRGRRSSLFSLNPFLSLPPLPDSNGPREEGGKRGENLQEKKKKEKTARKGTTLFDHYNSLHLITPTPLRCQRTRRGPEEKKGKKKPHSEQDRKKKGEKGGKRGCSAWPVSNRPFSNLLPALPAAAAVFRLRRGEKKEKSLCRKKRKEREERRHRRAGLLLWRCRCVFHPGASRSSSKRKKEGEGLTHGGGRREREEAGKTCPWPLSVALIIISFALKKKKKQKKGVVRGGKKGEGEGGSSSGRPTSTTIRPPSSCAVRSCSGKRRKRGGKNRSPKKGGRGRAGVESSSWWLFPSLARKLFAGTMSKKKRPPGEGERGEEKVEGGKSPPTFFHLSRFPFFSLMVDGAGKGKGEKKKKLAAWEKGRRQPLRVAVSPFTQ